MENHPIPQDITGFQFKLIGDMTVKQFAYLASGCILAWVFFSLPIPVLVKFPFASFCGLFGIGFAFIPIEGRPMDVMVVNFIKALFTPNQYVFQKDGGHMFSHIAAVVPASHAQTPARIDIQAYLAHASKPTQNKLDQKENLFFQSLFATPTAASPTIPPATVIPAAASQQPPIVNSDSAQNAKQKEEALEKEAQLIQKELETAKQEEVIHPDPQGDLTAHAKVQELQQQLSDLLAQKQQLEQQLFALSQKMQQQSSQQVYKPSVAKQLQETSRVRQIPKGMGTRAGLPTTPDYPNLITGIVKDPRGKILSNMLVEIKDKEGNPVRAFKTNSLGQFASATSLLNGSYTLVVEDPQEEHKFDQVEIIANGQIIPPLEIISFDQREELRRNLFGS